MKDPAKCIILVPTYSHVERETEHGLRELERRGYHIKWKYNCSQVDLVRSILASEALDAGYQELFWIDSDTAFNPDDVERLRESGHPFCAGMYTKKGIKGRNGLTAGFLPGTQKVVVGKEGGLLEVQSIGLGFTYTEASIFHAIKAHAKLPTCNLNFIPPFTPYFIPSLSTHDNGVAYLTEDLAFCSRARLCGFRVMVDTRIPLGHIGRKVYTWDDLVDYGTRESLAVELTLPLPTSAPSPT